MYTKSAFEAEFTPLGGAHSLAMGLKEKDLAKGFRFVFLGATSAATTDPAAQQGNHFIRNPPCGSGYNICLWTAQLIR